MNPSLSQDIQRCKEELQPLSLFAIVDSDPQALRLQELVQCLTSSQAKSIIPNGLVPISLFVIEDNILNMSQLEYGA